jgi:hypothetical protein
MRLEDPMAGRLGDAEPASRKLDQLDAFSEEVAQRSLRLLLGAHAPGAALNAPRPRGSVARRDSQ